MNSHLKVLYWPSLVRYNKQPKVWHLHHGLHISQHDRHVLRKLSTIWSGWLDTPNYKQHFHWYIHRRVYHEADCSQLAFLQNSVEYIRLAHCGLVNTWYANESRLHLLIIYYVSFLSLKKRYGLWEVHEACAHIFANNSQSGSSRASGTCTSTSEGRSWHSNFAVCFGNIHAGFGQHRLTSLLSHIHLRHFRHELLHVYKIRRRHKRAFQFRDHLQEYNHSVSVVHLGWLEWRAESAHQRSPALLWSRQADSVADCARRLRQQHRGQSVSCQLSDNKLSCCCQHVHCGHLGEF